MLPCCKCSFLVNFAMAEYDFASNNSSSHLGRVSFGCKMEIKDFTLATLLVVRPQL